MTEVLSKREQNKAKKRAEIVSTASELFFHNGYGATSMSAIAEKLGGSKATLWGYFSSKEELFAAVIEHHVNTFSQVIDEVITGQVFSKQAVHRACLRFLECLFHPNSVLLYRLIISESGRFPEIRETFYHQGPAKLHKVLCSFFETKFDSTEANDLTQIFVTSVLGYRNDVLLNPTPVTPEDHVRFADNLLKHLAFPYSGGSK